MTRGSESCRSAASGSRCCGHLPARQHGTGIGCIHYPCAIHRGHVPRTAAGAHRRIGQGARRAGPWQRDQKPPPAVALKRDKRGKGLTDDLQQYVLPPATEKRLAALEEGAKKDLQAGDLPGVQIGLADLRRSLAAEIARYQAIVGLLARTNRPPQPFAGGEARKSTLQANGIESPGQPEIEALSTQLDQEVAAGDFVAAMRTSWAEARRAAQERKDRRVAAAHFEGRQRRTAGGFARQRRRALVFRRRRRPERTRRTSVRTSPRRMTTSRT